MAFSPFTHLNSAFPIVLIVINATTDCMSSRTNRCEYLPKYGDDECIDRVYTSNWNQEISLTTFIKGIQILVWKL